MDVFPITLSCDPSKGWSEYSFRPFFMAVRPENMTWYGYDVIIESPTSVRFTVYDMLDSFYGGLGNIIGTFETVVPADLTRKHIINKALWIAMRLREQELERREDEVIGYMADSIMAKVYK